MTRRLGKDSAPTRQDSGETRQIDNNLRDMVNFGEKKRLKSFPIHIFEIYSLIQYNINIIHTY